MIDLNAAIRLLSARRILAAASICTVIGLIFMVLPSLIASPLFLIASISVAHGMGLLGVLLFALSVLHEVLIKTSGGKTDLSLKPTLPNANDPTAAGSDQSSSGK